MVDFVQLLRLSAEAASIHSHECMFLVWFGFADPLCILDLWRFHCHVFAIHDVAIMDHGIILSHRCCAPLCPYLVSVSPQIFRVTCSSAPQA